MNRQNGRTAFDHQNAILWPIARTKRWGLTSEPLQFNIHFFF